MPNEPESLWFVAVAEVMDVPVPSSRSECLLPNAIKQTDQFVRGTLLSSSSAYSAPNASSSGSCAVTRVQFSSRFADLSSPRRCRRWNCVPAMRHGEL